MNEGLTISAFFDAWELFRDPTYAGMIAGATLGLLGVYVVIRRIVFLSAALSQIAGLGIAVTFWAKISFGLSGFLASPMLGAATATLAAVLVVNGAPKSAKTRQDALLGALFLFGSAGTLALGSRITEELQDIQTLLFGSAVAVLPEDLTALAIVCGLIVLVHVWWWRGFVAVSLDPEDAKIRGMNVVIVDGVLLVSIAIAISMTTQILGALPAFAFSVLPAMAAIRFVKNVPQALLVSGIIGGASGFGGYVLAFLYSLPVGAAQTLVAAAFAAFAVLFSVARAKFFIQGN